jgi:uncharacterized membrane protein YozB (DUF420 family)
MVHMLPHVNAILNGLSTLLLLTGYYLIRQRREATHRIVMLVCFAVSILFLISYSIYHAQAGHVRFPDYPPQFVRIAYRAVLWTHVVLAAFVPLLAAVTLYLGLAGRRDTHRHIARFTFPIWLYVSVTGVLVYLMLYQLYPPRETAVKMQSWQDVNPARAAPIEPQERWFIDALA